MMNVDLAVASHSTSVWSSLKHLVTPTDVADQEQQEHRGQDPDGFASPRPKEKDAVDEIDDPTEDEQGDSPFRIPKSSWDKRKESRRKHVDQRPKADVDGDQCRGPGGGIEDDSNSKRNSRSFRHWFVLFSFGPKISRMCDRRPDKPRDGRTPDFRDGGDSLPLEIRLFMQSTLKTI
jgi:hypothetical protein